MKRLLNTLYVTSQGGYVSRDGETILVSTDEGKKTQIPILNLEALVCFGHVAVTTGAMQLCAENKVGLCFLSDHGRFVSRVQGRAHGNVLLRRAQYRIADDPVRSLPIAAAIVAGKIANARAVLLRARRDSSSELNTRIFDDPIRVLGEALFLIEKVSDIGQLLGIEGDAARTYFDVFDHLIVVQKECFQFRGRNRRPPLDPVNALLSFLYTLLAHDTSSALECVGLDPSVGFLHRDRPGRPSLALDLMEELRSYVADRLALSLINRGQVRKQDFSFTESGAVLMSDQLRKTVLVAYQTRKREEVEHPFLGEKVEIGLLPYAQSLLLARHIRGDLEGYPPFTFK